MRRTFPPTNLPHRTGYRGTAVCGHDMRGQTGSLQFESCGVGVSPSTKLLPSQKFVWAPPHCGASLRRIVPAFESYMDCAQAQSSVGAVYEKAPVGVLFLWLRG